jgi:hypothetical protein
MFAQMVRRAAQMFARVVAIFREEYHEIGQSIEFKTMKLTI